MSDRTPSPHKEYTGLEDLDRSPLPLSSLPTSPVGSESDDNSYSFPPVTPPHHPTVPNDTPIPVISSPVSSMIASSPIRGHTREEKAASRAKKRQHQREVQKQAKLHEKQAAEVAKAVAKCKIEERRAKQVESTCRQTLDFMAERGITFGDLVLYVSNPEMKQGDSRWNGFFGIPGRVAEVLNYWVSSRNSQSGRDTVRNWALDYVGRILDKEGEGITNSGLLRSENKLIDKSYTVDFSLDSLYQKIKDAAPAMTKLLHAFSTTKRQQQAAETPHNSKPVPEVSQKKQRVRRSSDIFIILWQCHRHQKI